MTWDRLAPWDPRDGSLISFADTFAASEPGVVWTPSGHVKADWRPADEPFFAVLNFKEFTRGRSAARAMFTINGRGGTVEMFLRDLSDLLKAGQFLKPSMDGWWIVVKRGANFGVRLASLDTKEKS